MTFALTPDRDQKADEYLTRYPSARAALLPVLWLCQEQNGWISPEVIDFAARRLDLSTAAVKGVVTFYTMFHQAPVGDHVVWVCRTLSCDLRGAKAIQEHLEGRFGCHAGGTSTNGKFSLRKAECLAACGQAPMVQIDDRYYENLDLGQLDRILDTIERDGIEAAVERFARTDTSATPQALKLVTARPDAMLVVASGSGAAMPHKALVERGFKGKIYQTHAAATPDLVRIGGKDVEGSYVVSGPAVIAEQLPDNHPSKAVAIDFVTKFEAAVGPGQRNQFAGHAYDTQIVMEKVLPVALQKARPGTPEFRAALRDAIETMGRTILAHGVMNWTADDHWGYTNETGVMLRVEGGKFVVEK